MRRLLLAFGSLWAGFFVLVATFAALVRGTDAPPVASVVAVYVTAFVGGSLLALPYFVRPPAFVREQPWRIRMPIPFSRIVLVPLGWVGYLVIAAPWRIVDALRSRAVPQATGGW